MNKRLHNKCLDLNNKFNILRDEIHEMLTKEANIWNKFYPHDMVDSYTNGSGFVENKNIIEILDSFKKELLKMKFFKKELSKELTKKENELCKYFLKQIKKYKDFDAEFKTGRFISLLK